MHTTDHHTHMWSPPNSVSTIFETRSWIKYLFVLLNYSFRHLNLEVQTCLSMRMQDPWRHGVQWLEWKNLCVLPVALTLAPLNTAQYVQNRKYRTCIEYDIFKI